MKTKFYTIAKKHAQDSIPSNGNIEIGNKKGSVRFVWVMKNSQAICTMYFSGDCSGASLTQRTSGYGYDKPSSAVSYCIREAFRRLGHRWGYQSAFLPEVYTYALSAPVEKALRKIEDAGLAGRGLEVLRGKKFTGVKITGV